MRKHRSGNARSSTAPPSLRKALAFASPPDAAISPASNDDSITNTTATPTLSSVEPEGRPRELIATEGERSPSSIGPASPAASTIITEVASNSPSTWGSAAKSNGDLPEPEVSAGVPGQDVKAAGAAAPEFLVWARSTATTSSSADDLSKKVAAAVLKALEDGAATAAGEGKGRGPLDPLLFLAKVNVAVLCFLLLMSSAMLILCLSSPGGCPGRNFPPYPSPPT